jgi:hypothetical protein
MQFRVSSPPIAVCLIALMLSACSTAVGSAPSPSASDSPASPAPATPVATPSPSDPVVTPEPSAPATPKPSAPATPSKAPTPTVEPIQVVRFDVPTIMRVTANGVAVRVLPGVEQPLVEGYHQEGHTIDGVRLKAGDTVEVRWGPVFVDGHSWYNVGFGDTDGVTFSNGWMAADYLVAEGSFDYPLVMNADGLGSGKAVTGEVTAWAPLYVNVVAVPMPGKASCEAEVVLIGTDGAAVTIGSAEITRATLFSSSAAENDDLYQEAAGTVTLQVRSDCTWAGMAFIPVG